MIRIYKGFYGRYFVVDALRQRCSAHYLELSRALDDISHKGIPTVISHDRWLKNYDLIFESPSTITTIADMLKSNPEFFL